MKNVPIEKIIKDYEYCLSDFQKQELCKLYEKGLKVIDFYVVDDNDELYLKTIDNKIKIESVIIHKEDDVFFSCIGKYDYNLDQLVKIN
jgi:hypothetical protein